MINLLLMERSHNVLSPLHLNLQSRVRTRFIDAVPHIDIDSNRTHSLTLIYVIKSNNSRS